MSAESHGDTRVLLRNLSGQIADDRNLCLWASWGAARGSGLNTLRPYEERTVGFPYVIFQPDEKMVRRKEGGAGSVGSIQGVGTGPETGHVKACSYTP